MKNTFNLALVMLTAALFGSGLRQVENGSYTAASFAGLGIVAIATVGVIRFRNWLDRRAIQN